MRLTRILTAAVLVLLAASVGVAGLIHRPLAAHGPAVRLVFLMQMLLVIALAVAYRRRLRLAALDGAGTDREVASCWRSASAMILAGACLSVVGDFINAHIVDLTHIVEAQTLLSIPFFGAAQILYALAFLRISAEQTATRTGLRLGTVAAWPVVSVALWWIAIGPGAAGAMRWATLGYTFLVVGMGIASVRVAAAFGRPGILTAVGALLFVVSDGMIGAFLPNQAPRPWGLVIWTTYLVAQLLIVRTLRLGVPREVLPLRPLSSPETS